MAYSETNAVVAIRGAYDGAAGTTEIKGARRAGLRFSRSRKTVPGSTGPRASITTYRQAQVFVETPSMALALAHEAKTADEIVVLDFIGFDTADQANRKITIDPVSPAGVDQIRIPDRETGEVVPVDVLTWDVLEEDAQALLAAFTEAADA